MDFANEAANIDSTDVAVLLEQALALSPSPNPLEVEVLDYASEMSEAKVKAQ